MQPLFQSFAALPDPVQQMVLLGGIGLGILVVFLGVVGVFAGVSPEVRRLHVGAGARGAAGRLDLISRGDADPRGIFKVFVPTSRKERSNVARQMRRAGIHRPEAVRDYFIVRSLLGLILPSLLVSVVYAPVSLGPLHGISTFANQLGLSEKLVCLTGVLALGFYSPALWLRSRIERRRKQIERGLPNALDLLQVAVEAGMGFDAAMTRIAREMATVVPPIAEEFMRVQLEIQAGMDREKAFLSLSERVGVEEVSAFANVILQSAQFGTSISSALQTYADEMRTTRELKAQEKANKLPVKMSGAMALLMMPTLLMITLTPVAIRWVRMAAES